MFEKGWFVPVKRDGSIYYVKAEEGAENAVVCNSCSGDAFAEEPEEIDGGGTERARRGN